MSHKTLFWSSLLIPILLTACGVSARPMPQPSPSSTSSGQWTLQFSQSGGFAGVLLLYQVASDGSFSAADGRSGRRITGQLDPESLTKLDQLLVDADRWSSPSRPSACADCFIYDLQLVSIGGTPQVHADDTSLESTGAQAVVLFLIKMRDAALASTK